MRNIYIHIFSLSLSFFFLLFLLSQKVTLQNCGPEAFRPEIYGKEIAKDSESRRFRKTLGSCKVPTLTILRTITKSGMLLCCLCCVLLCCVVLWEEGEEWRKKKRADDFFYFFPLFPLFIFFYIFIFYFFWYFTITY